MAGDEIKAPKVFISYSQDSSGHEDRVLALSNRLVKDGLHCNIDQYVDSPPEGWQRWMEREIQEADFVLVICTARYLRRVKGEKKPDIENGVRWESIIMYQGLYDAGTLNTKFIPILFEGASPSDIPTPIKSATRYFLTTEAGYKELYRRLTNQPLRRRPKTGELLKLPPIEPTPDFLFSRSEPTLKNSQEPLIRHSEDTSAPLEQIAISGMQEKLQEHSHPEGNTLVPPVGEHLSKTGPGQQSNIASLVNKMSPSLINELKVTKPSSPEDQPAQPAPHEEISTSERPITGTPKVLTKQQIIACRSANRHYEGIREREKTVKDAHRLFSKTQVDIYSDQCRLMINPVLKLSKPIQNFNIFLEKAHLPTDVYELRSQLKRKLNRIEVLLSELARLKMACCLKDLKAPIKQRQDIQRILQELVERLERVNNLMRTFNRLLGLLEDALAKAQGSVQYSETPHSP